MVLLLQVLVLRLQVLVLHVLPAGSCSDQALRRNALISAERCSAGCVYHSILCCVAQAALEVAVAAVACQRPAVNAPVHAAGCAAWRVAFLDCLWGRCMVGRCMLHV
jgi:hypothetical protein